MVCYCCSFAKSCLTLQPHGLEPASRLCPWKTSGKNTGAIPFSRRSSPPRDWTTVSYISRWILYHWATREVQELIGLPLNNGGREEYIWPSGCLLWHLVGILVQHWRQMDKYSSHSLSRWGPGTQGSLNDEGMDHSPGKPLWPREVLAEGKGNLDCVV